MDTPRAGLNSGGQLTVRIDKPFYIMKHEVTNRMWNHFARETGKSDVLAHHLIGGKDASAPDMPRPYISQEDAEAFVEFLGRATSIPFRIPTEVEWEWAARLGYRADRPLSETAVYEVHGVPREACSLERDAWGLCDMLGNLMELTIPRTIPTRLRKAALYKGGAFPMGPKSVSPSTQIWIARSVRFVYSGLRLVADLPES